ncbi:3-oxoacyl-[acyl-carrier protein] reductase [Bryocella elongata]|uniref:3-oxoacyl-[acyl-carrier protein] reductase n=1 Tax=Bryocella elongata TaxID=863522 RepID=A0A1H5SPK2_9BACT|nr:SDR family oxidoreductase [Bryocella elongata]SEF52499.1 3-oxoacyl-[acyl-carrier protein] reductase [Bryocella elongata]
MTASASPDLVVVTGAGRGIGHAIAMDQGKRAHVLCLSRSGRAVETAEAIRVDGGSADALVVDLERPEESEATLTEWLRGKPFSRIAAVFAAGVLGPEGPLEASSIAAWETTFRANVFGNLAIAKAILPKQRANSFGRLLFFGGGGAAYAYPAFPAYAASKAALVRIVENLHEDLKDAGDFATAILAPGAIETDMLARVRETGAEIRTTVGIEEPVAFARAFLAAESCGFSGRFVHVRDRWPEYLNGGEPLDANLWKLRRVE